MPAEVLGCKSCHSENLAKFNAEVAIHFPGLKNINKPPLFVFPELMVCLDCGVAQFSIPIAELRVLAKRDAAGAR